MNLPVSLGAWDFALIGLVSLQVTAIAYAHAPRWKAVLLSLPIPFTFGSLALGSPVNVTHVAGLLLFLAFTHAVRLLHYGAKLPIVPAIALSAAGNAVAGACLARLLPKTDLAFGAVAALSVLVAVWFYLSTPDRQEPGHRTPLPLWKKLPAVAALLFGLVMAKGVLQGFMALFPMVGVFTAYEARHSLWAICRQAPAILLAFVPMIVTVRLAQGRLGLGMGLALGWIAFACVLTPLVWRLWFAGRRASG